MVRMFSQIYHAVYMAIFLCFTRKIITKVKMMFDDCIPVVNEDGSEWYAVRLFHRYFIFTNMCRGPARELAMLISSDVPETRGHIEVVQHDDAEETSLADIPELSGQAVADIMEIWDHFEPD